MGGVLPTYWMGFSYAIVKDIIVTLSIEHKLAYLKSSHLCPLQIFWSVKSNKVCQKLYKRRLCVSLPIKGNYCYYILWCVHSELIFFKKRGPFFDSICKVYKLLKLGFRHTTQRLFRIFAFRPYRNSTYQFINWHIMMNHKPLSHSLVTT